MANGIRTGDPRGFNKGRISKFRVGSWVRQTPEEGRRTYRPKRCGNNNKDEDNSPKTLNDKNQASSQKFRQVYYLLRNFIRNSSLITFIPSRWTCTALINPNSVISIQFPCKKKKTRCLQVLRYNIKIKWIPVSFGTCFQNKLPPWNSSSVLSNQTNWINHCILVHLPANRRKKIQYFNITFNHTTMY